MRYITETRNLFDINSVTDIKHVGTDRILPHTLWSIKNNSLITKVNYYDIGACIFLPTLNLEPGTYTLSAYCVSNHPRCFVGIRDFNKSKWFHEAYNTNTQIEYKFEITEKSEIGLMLQGYNNGFIGTFSNIQLELGSTATPYVPYGYLPMRRMKYKVSNVCQLLDKTKYPETNTVNGVTFTNNGDGTITANGTATGLCQYRITNSYKKLIGENTNKCLLVGSISANSGTPYYLQLDFLEGNSWSRAALDFGKGVIFTNSYSSTQLLSIIVRSGATVNNLTFKPQLFDLTEMYGAGNEPTTVEEFRAKFPNDLYDYSPHCFITSYKNCLTCKTKNLFDCTKVSGLINSVSGVSLNNFLIINGTSFTNRYSSYAASAHIIPSFILKAGTYTISLLAKGTDPGNKGVFGIVKFNSDGTQTDFQGYWTSSDSRQSYTFTLDEDSEVAIRIQGFGNASNYLNLDSTFKDIQLELGDTATDYVPYGYLPLK